jgi:tRNA (cmo5U34)-methyltransferase
MNRDRVFRDPQHQIVDFTFDDRVAGVFEDMIRRSVPGYEVVVPMSGLIAARYAKPNLRCYDLGCSLGATALAIRRQLTAPDVTVVAVDNSEAMLARARTLINEPIEWRLADIRDTDLTNASVVVMNWTLQFLDPDDRLPLMSRIHQALCSDGVLIVSEKIRSSDASEQARLEQLHLAFKAANGYSDLEIAQKRTALENVLLPDTVDDHRRRFFDAGFSRADLWFQCLNWVSFIVAP